MDAEQYPKAYKSYQQAISRAIYQAIGFRLVYFVMNQYDGGRYAFNRSIRLNDYIPESWYNFGVLVSIRRFYESKTIN